MYSSQRANVARAVDSISPVFRGKRGVLITHGNGMQVGEEFLRNEYAEREVETLSWPALVAETQATIGTMLETAILGKLRRMRIRRGVSALLTHVLISPNDRAFRKPEKPVGPLYSKRGLGVALKHERFAYVKVSGGYRRVVASPEPVGIAEIETISHLISGGRVIIAGGGGGIPIVNSSGSYPASPAVIDKDLTAQLIATLVGADTLVILTGEEYVYLDYPKRAKPIKTSRATELKRMLGGFEGGTMRPKVDACIRFIEKGGRRAFIGGLGSFESIMEGRSGTRIIR